MNRASRRVGRTAAVLLCCVALSACAALELVNRQPPRLFQLTPKSTFDPALPELDTRLSVEVPTATTGLNTARVALRPTPTTLEYYAGASWIDVVPVMVQNLLVESLDNTQKIDVIGREVAGVRAGYALLTHIREFQAEYDGSPAPPEIRVRIQARLIRLPRRISIAATSRETVVVAQTNSLNAIVEAFDQAFGDVVKDVVEWSLGELAEAETPAG